MLKTGVPSNGFLPARRAGIRYFSCILAFYLLLSLVYFHDAVFGGKLLAPGDGASYFYPLRVMAASFAHPLASLWNHNIFSGFPFLAPAQPAILYPPNWLALLIPVPYAYNLLVVAHYVLAAFFVFLYAGLLGARGLPAFLAGMVFAFMGFMASHLQHKSLIDAAAWFPVALYLFEKLKRTLDIKYALVAAIVIALQTYAGHPQTVFQSLLVIGFFAVFHVVAIERSKKGRFFALCMLAFALGALLALPQIVSTMELTGLSTRTGMSAREFTAFSFPPHMAPSVFFPFLWGGGYGGKYWGPFIDLTVPEGFIGSLPLLVGFFAFIGYFRKEPNVRFLGLVAAVGFVLSFGRYLPFYELLVNVPVLNYFRAPSRHWFEVDLALSVLFSLGLTVIMYDDGQRFLKRAVAAALLSLISVSAVLVTVFREPLFGYLVSEFDPMRQDLMRKSLSLTSSGVLLPLAFMAAYALWFLLYRPGPRQGIFGALLALIIFSEAFSYRTAFAGRPGIEELESRCESGVFKYIGDKTDGRTAFVHDKLQPMQGAMCGLRMVDGYEPLIIGRYGVLLDLDYRGVYNAWPATLSANGVLSMLNAKYIVVSPSMAAFMEDIKKGGEPIYEKIFSDGESAAYANRKALPMAYTVSSLRVFKDSDRMVEFIKSPFFNPADEAVLREENFAGAAGRAFAKTDIGVVYYRPGDVKLEVGPAGGEGFVVLSEQYYPGWRVYIDGKGSKPYRTNSVLMGAVVPAGAHDVVFRYRPFKVYAAFGVSLITLAGMACLLISKRKSRC